VHYTNTLTYLLTYLLKCTKIRLAAGLRTHPTWGAYAFPQTPDSHNGGLILREKRKGEGWERRSLFIKRGREGDEAYF